MFHRTRCPGCIWVGNYAGQTLTKLRAYDGAVMDTVNLGTRIDDIAFDGAHVWVTSGSNNQVVKLRTSDGPSSGPNDVAAAGSSSSHATVWHPAQPSDTKASRPGSGCNPGPAAR